MMIGMRRIVRKPMRRFGKYNPHLITRLRYKRSQDIDSHPAFVTEVDPNPGTLSSEMEAIQAIKFEAEDSGVSVMNYKNEGNHYYQKKTYTLAIVNYTKGLKLNVDDNEMGCILYTNRAACHFHQGKPRRLAERH